MKKLTFAIIALLGMGFGAAAQDTKTDNHTVTIDVPTVALLDIELASAKNISMAFSAPTEAGLGITSPAANGTLWLNYSSIVTSGAGLNPARSISVRVGATIPGVNIIVTPGTPVMTTGAGTGGTAGAAVTLTTAGQDIITAIGSCYTGDGSGAGSNLSYAIAAPVANYGLLTSGTTVATVTYTLSDNI